MENLRASIRDARRMRDAIARHWESAFAALRRRVVVDLHDPAAGKLPFPLKEHGALGLEDVERVRPELQPDDIAFAAFPLEGMKSRLFLLTLGDAAPRFLFAGY